MGRDFLYEKMKRDVNLKRKPGQRGAQRLPTKIKVTIRYDREIVEYFKETGEGWQTRINNVLLNHVNKFKTEK